MIPRRVFVLFDLVVLTGAFVIAFLLAPRLQQFVLQGAPLRLEWLETFLALPDANAVLTFRPIDEVVWVLVLTGTSTVAVMHMLNGYEPLLRQSRTKIVMTSVAGPLIGLSLVTMILFAVRANQWSRLFIFSFSTLSSLELCSYRLALRWYRARRMNSGFDAKDVALIGPTTALEWLYGYLTRSLATSEYRIVGYIRVEPGQKQPFAGLPDAESRLPPLGHAHELGALLVHRPIHEIIAVHGGNGADWLRGVVDDCDYFRLTLRIVPDALLYGNLRDLRLLYRTTPFHLPEIVLKPIDLDSDALFLKRLLDIVISAALLVLLSPLLMLIAAAIKLTTPRLPIFYRWNVIGYKGRPFVGYKFTTMDSDADTRRTELLSRNEMTGPVFKIHNDPRVTPLGRWLRKFSLNELPQLWSVLRGDMSLVGPRPAFRHELDRYELWHKRKLCVRPGITCLWQVRGRNRIVSFDDWVRMDLEYIDNWSLWLDMKILARTAWTVVAGTGS